MENVNQEWLDALLRHQIYLLRVAGAIRNKVDELLLKTEDEIATQIREMLRGDLTFTPKRLAKAEAALKKVKAIRNAGWDRVDNELFAQLMGYAQEETIFLARALETVLPVLIESNLPSPQSLRSMVKTRPFEGRTLKEWASTLQTNDLRRIEDQIKIGLVRGEPSDRIARRIVGTAKLKGADGVTQITRRNAEAIIRTAVNSFSNGARDMFFQANADLFGEELFVATLDGRTTPICRSYDGKRFKLGEGPHPPLHFSCRSIRVAAITPEAIGNRPARPFAQRTLLREFARQEGLGKIGSRDRLPRGYKGEFDSFAGRRMREMTQIIPAKINYQEWLTRQTAAFQDDVLGPTRGKLFRQGGVTLDRFVNRAGDEIPLAQLAQRDANAFIAAGFDPEAFYR